MWLQKPFAAAGQKAASMLSIVQTPKTAAAKPGPGLLTEILFIKNEPFESAGKRQKGLQQLCLLIPAAPPCSLPRDEEQRGKATLTCPQAGQEAARGRLGKC